MKLRHLLEDLSCLILQGHTDVDIQAIVFREENLKEGALFICVPDPSFPKDFSLSGVIDKGAAAVLLEESILRDSNEVVPILPSQVF